MSRRRSASRRTARTPGTSDRSGILENRVRPATVLVFLACVAVFFGTATIFQIEDDNPLTGLAFDAAPLLGASPMCAHLAALAVLVIVVAGAGLVIFALWRGSTALWVRAFALFFCAVVAFAALALLGLVVLYVRLGGSIVSASTGWSHGLSVSVAAGAFAAFVVAVLVIGRRVVGAVGQANRSVLRFCVGAVLAMLVNVMAAITHTVALVSANPELFADSVDQVTIKGYGSTSGFYYSELIVANTVAAAFAISAAVFVARAVIKLRVEQSVPSP